MFLKRLEIHGFKSFAKKTVLEFDPGMISVVGPNGSGKSNIADSLRWVFGEQSMKLLRGKKSEDVIFAGSDQKARLGAAEVAVYFDNLDHRMPLDYSEVMIARRLFRDGNSEYLINGNQVRLLDIQELLAKSGFGNTSYHVIGQGMIDQLVVGGPAAIKELLEEASGVKPYYVKRERALRRLDRTKNNLDQVQALAAEIEPRLRSLRRQAKRLEQRETVEKELRGAQILHYAQILHGLDGQIREVDGKLKVFEEQTSALNTEIKSLSEEIAKQEHFAAPAGSGNYQKLQNEIQALQQKKFAMLEELAIVRGKIKIAESRVPKELAIDWQALKIKFQQANERLEKLFANFQESEVPVVRKLFREVAQLIEQADAAASLAVKAELKELLETEQKLNKEVAALLSQIQKFEDDLADFLKQESTVKQQLFVKERLLRNKQDTLYKTAEQKNSLKVDQARLSTRRETYQQEIRNELGPGHLEQILQTHPTSIPAGLQEKISNLKRQLSMIGGVDELVAQEYQETETRYQYLTTQGADLEKGISDLKLIIKDLDEEIKKEFNEAFVKISEKFAEYFRVLFNGGRAMMAILRERILTEEEREAENPAADDEGTPVAAPSDSSAESKNLQGKTEIVGIDIKATPPGKKLAGISALSGGERALTSIALLCAILASYPSPFVVLDEVDAALDEANSIRFGKILGTLANKTQFITISHNRETMRQSHTLYGVTMGDDGVSKVLSLKLEQAAVYSTKN